MEADKPFGAAPLEEKYQDAQTKCHTSTHNKPHLVLIRFYKKFTNQTLHCWDSKISVEPGSSSLLKIYKGYSHDSPVIVFI